MHNPSHSCEDISQLHLVRARPRAPLYTSNSPRHSPPPLAFITAALPPRGCSGGCRPTPPGGQWATAVPHCPPFVRPHRRGDPTTPMPPSAPHPPTTTSGPHPMRVGRIVGGMGGRPGSGPSEGPPPFPLAPRSGLGGLGRCGSGGVGGLESCAAECVMAAPAHDKWPAGASPPPPLPPPCSPPRGPSDRSPPHREHEGLPGGHAAGA